MVVACILQEENFQGKDLSIVLQTIDILDDHYFYNANFATVALQQFFSHLIFCKKQA